MRTGVMQSYAELCRVMQSFLKQPELVELITDVAQ